MNDWMAIHHSNEQYIATIISWGNGYQFFEKMKNSINWNNWNDLIKIIENEQMLFSLHFWILISFKDIFKIFQLFF
jgi:hypothetical protein